MLGIQNPSYAWASAPPGITIGQWERELSALVELYKGLKPKVVVEIGTHQGGTLHRWLTQAPAGLQVVISVDLGPTGWRPAEPGFDMGQWQAWVPPGVEFYPIIGASKDNATLEQVINLTGGSIDFLFIDADHSYEGSRADFLNYGLMVRDGGIIALHDLITPEFSPHIQVGKLWQEIRASGLKVQELYSHPLQQWGGIGVVHI